MDVHEQDDPEVDAPRASLAALTEQQREQAMARYRAIRAYVEVGTPLTEIAQRENQPLRTLRRWVRSYRTEGLLGLASQSRNDSGRRRRLTEEMEQLVEGLALKAPPLPIREIHRQVSAVAARRGQPIPSYTLIRSIVNAIPDALRTLALEGTKAYTSQFDLVVRREAAGPNAMWQADHCELDILLIRPNLPAAKPWLTVIEDDFSRAVAGYFLSFEAPCTLHTALALRQAIWRKEDPRWHVCGIPEVFYTDNGSDFTSKHMEQVAADLKMRLVFSTPGAPRGRGRIERFFETVQQMLLPGLPGYAPPGHGGSARPQWTLTQLDACFRDFVLNTYHVRQHGETGHPPQQRWETGGFLPQMPRSLEQLDLLLLTVAQARKVHPDGIRFQGMRYIDPTLAAYVGEHVILRYDPRDMAEIRVFHQDGFVCRAVCQELAGETVPLRDIIQARNRRRRELRRELQNRQRTVERLLATRRWEAATDEQRPEVTEEPPEPTRLKRYLNE